SDAICGQIQPAGLHRAVHSLLPYFPYDVKPIASHVGFAANQSNFTRAHACELAHEVEAFVRRQLVRAAFTCTRAAMIALEITSESDLPHGVHGRKRRTVARRKIA